MDNYLVHYGILGQKWGVRRFQNKDGSLTAEGKERYVRSFKGVKQPFYYNLPDNKKDKRLADTFRYNVTKKMNREDWDKLYKGTKDDHYAIAEKIAKQMLGEELFNTKMQDISDLSKLQTYGEFEIKRLLPDYSEDFVRDKSHRSNGSGKIDRSPSGVKSFVQEEFQKTFNDKKALDEAKKHFLEWDAADKEWRSNTDPSKRDTLNAKKRKLEDENEYTKMEDHIISEFMKQYPDYSERDYEMILDSMQDLFETKVWTPAFNGK